MGESVGPALADGVSAAVVFLSRSHSARARFPGWLYLALAMASHGLFDAFTNGGLGVALLAPFSNERFFFPWQPIEVSPLGLSRIFSARGVEVLASELLWVGIPSLGVALLGVAEANGATLVCNTEVTGIPAQPVGFRCSIK